jgi:hypothetical protein
VISKSGTEDRSYEWLDKIVAYDTGRGERSYDHVLISKSYDM